MLLKSTFNPMLGLNAEINGISCSRVGSGRRNPYNSAINMIDNGKDRSLRHHCFHRLPHLCLDFLRLLHVSSPKPSSHSYHSQRGDHNRCDKLTRQAFDFALTITTIAIFRVTIVALLPILYTPISTPF